MKQSEPIPPSVLLIFGITGELATGKIIPALYQLEKDGLLPEHFYIFGTSRRNIGPKQAETLLGSRFKPDNKQAFKRLAHRVKIVRFDTAIADDYPRLRTALEGFEQSKGIPLNLLLYLATAPETIIPVVEKLAAGRLNRPYSQDTECRLLLEKPFGSDYGSAKKQVKVLQRCFKEKAIYRLDHHLAKETVQNILTVRDRNPWLKALWSAKHIKAIEVCAFEKQGVEGEAALYDEAGALRDMIQTHLLQLLATVTMHVPSDPTAEDMAKARLDILRNIRPLRPRAARKALRGQYRSYHKEVGRENSTTETFASVPMVIDRAHWRHTRIRLSTGKSLQRSETYIAVWFSDFAKNERQNVLIFRIQPQEGIGITLLGKKPGTDEETEYITLGHMYPKVARSQNVYKSELLSAFHGDQTLFPTSEEVLASWRIINPLLQRWLRNGTGLITYKNGANPQKIADEAP